MQRLRIESNGKRGRIEIQLDDGAVVTSAIERVSFERVEGVRQSFRSLDDFDVELVIEPLDGCRVRVEVAEIDFWLDDEDPAEILTPTAEKLTKLRGAFDFRIALGLVHGRP
ncbi:MAG: hypothetical protein HYV09_09960 [Deltaproteobacteria bacterium]|nr:hypothetical protein [Deltaproteobacteria bacterium]